MTHASYTACHDCDLLQRRIALPPGGAALCVRCGALLYHNRRNTIERALALTLTGAVLFVVANAFPFLALEFQGQTTHSTLGSGVRSLYASDMHALAGLVLLTTILIPLLELSGMLLVLLPLQFGRRPRFVPTLYRWIRRLQPWSMMEVFMLGILVSVVKLGAMAHIVPGLALWAFALMIGVVAWASATLNPDELWERFDTSTAANVS